MKKFHILMVGLLVVGGLKGDVRDYINKQDQTQVDAGVQLLSEKVVSPVFSKTVESNFKQYIDNLPVDQSKTKKAVAYLATFGGNFGLKALLERAKKAEAKGADAKGQNYKAIAGDAVKNTETAVVRDLLEYCVHEVARMIGLDAESVTEAFDDYPGLRAVKDVLMHIAIKECVSQAPWHK